MFNFDKKWWFAISKPKLEWNNNDKQTDKRHWLLERNNVPVNRHGKFSVICHWYRRLKKLMSCIQSCFVSLAFKKVEKDKTFIVLYSSTSLPLVKLFTTPPILSQQPYLNAPSDSDFKHVHKWCQKLIT